MIVKLPMGMKWSIAGFAILASASAFAQVDAREQMVQAAFTDMAGNPLIYVDLVGTEQLGTRTTPVEVVAYFYEEATAAGAITYKLDLESYVNNVLTRRIVGDGTYLFRYEVDANTYSAVPYGNSPLVAPVDSLLRTLSGMSGDESQYVSMLLTQLYQSQGTQYHNWVGGAQLIGSPTIVTPPTSYVGANASISYGWSVDTTGVHLGDISFSGQQPLAGTTKTTTWTMSVTPLLTVSPKIFRFVPPANAMPISLGR